MPRALSDSECATEASLMQVASVVFFIHSIDSSSPPLPLLFLQKLSHPHILKIHDILSDAEYM